MNRLFRKLPLPAKLMLMALIPLGLLIFFAIEIYREKTQKISILQTYLKRTEQSATIGQLIDQLQAERRYSFGYALSRNWRAELVIQRPKTDVGVKQLLSLPQMEKADQYTLLDSLSAFRQLLDNEAATPDDVMEYYSNTIFRLNTLNVISGGSIGYLEPVMGALLGQKILSEMVTSLGRVRAHVYRSLYSVKTSAQAAAEIRPFYALYKTYQRELELKTSGTLVDSLNTVMRSRELRATIGYIEQLIGQGTYDSSLTAEEWWNISAVGVDRLRQLRTAVLQDAEKGVQAIYQKEINSRNRTLVLLIICIVVVIAIMGYTTAIISGMLGTLSKAAERISTGETGLEIPVESEDMIGNLARSIQRIERNGRLLATAAAAIGSGDFSTGITPRSSNDLLGNALLRMKNDLQRYAADNEQKLWQHEGLELLNESLRGEKEVDLLARDILQVLVPFLQGQAALLYVSQYDFLRFSAGYAIEGLHTVPQRIGLGETLVGQAALKKESIHLKGLPESFLRISSGMGSSYPQDIIVVPLVHNNIVEGVLELGALAPLSEKSQRFLDAAAPAIAIALQSAKSRARLQELLEQVQAQSEELQAQHSELENINAELEAQAEKLQASEEELKVQQEELMQANTELEERSRLLEERNQLIVEKNIDIQRKAEELAQSSRYKSEFLANMSHELRTPLNSVLLLSRLLAENNEQNLSPEQVEYARVIQSSGQGLLSLIDEILDLSKIEAGKMELEYHSVMVGEIVNDMKALFAPVAAERGIELRIHTDAATPSQLETDKMRLEQILRNLLSNALKFTAQGSVTLLVAPAAGAPGFISFAVKDTGIGIPAEKQGIIFEAFQQADGSTRRKYGGTGLGLSISRELARLLGGEIVLQSQAGSGSCFTLTIPVSKALAKAEDGESPAPAAEKVPVAETQRRAYRAENIPEPVPDDRSEIGPGDKVILVIEDDIAFAGALLKYTRSRGYKGLVAVRGDEGIALAQQYRPLGILLDIQLPVKDGWEVMEELKSNPATRHIPVHIMSSLEARKESLMKGAVDFINKPVAFEQMQEVFRKIEHVLSKEHKKVLIVEENPQHAKALSYFLETFNVATEISQTVNKGVDALKKNEVDCVILDMGIPDQQAYETLENIRKTPGLEQLPIIIFTGRSLSKSEELRIRQYADSIVIKTAHSYQRILDEVSLFLHLVESSREEEKKPASRYKRLGALGEVLAHKKILIVDDDVRNIFSLTKALEMHDMQAITAVDGKEALSRLAENPDTDVVLMDIMMPEMDGYEAMQNIRRQPRFRNLPIIAVTAKAMTGDREKCIRAGASDYISKPVDIDQLLSLLRVWLYDKNI